MRHMAGLPDDYRKDSLHRKVPPPTLIALGANLTGPNDASPLQICRWATAALDGLLPGLRLAAVSRWYRTRPEPPQPGAPDFVNGMARLEGAAEGLDPAALLAALQRMEA